MSSDFEVSLWEVGVAAGGGWLGWPLLNSIAVETDPVSMYSAFQLISCHVATIHHLGTMPCLLISL